MNKISLLIAIVVMCSVGCSKDGNSNSIELMSSDPTLKYGDQFQIEASSESTIIYSSENEYHAVVSTSGLVTAKRVGETNIVLANSDHKRKLKITIKPESNLYPEPALTFGMKRSDVIKKIGQPDSSTESGILYDNYSVNAPIFMCIFDESDKLDGYSVMVKTGYSGELGTFLGERYIPASINSGNYSIAYVNGLDKNTISMAVGASLYNISYWMVMYFPFTLTRNADTMQDSRLMEVIEQLMAEI